MGLAPFRQHDSYVGSNQIGRQSIVASRKGMMDGFVQKAVATKPATGSLMVEWNVCWGSAQKLCLQTVRKEMMVAIPVPSLV